MSLHTELQRKVIEEAKRRLKDKSWYKGVCIDNLYLDHEIKLNFEEAVQQVIDDTIMWDGDGGEF